MDVNEIIAAVETMPEEIASYEDPADPEVRGGWQIANLGSADWALQRKAECDAEAEEIDRQAEAAIERIRERAAKLKAKALRGARYFEFKLAEWAERNRGQILKGKAKSRAFVAGTIGWRKVGGRLVVKDKDALSAWLATQPPESCLYRLKYEPEMAEIQQRFRANGEIPPGMEYEPEDDLFYVKCETPPSALVKGE